MSRAVMSRVVMSTAVMWHAGMSRARRSWRHAGATSLLLCLQALSGCGDAAPTRQPLKIGEAFTSTLTLDEVEGALDPVVLTSLLGPRATVFYAWSVPCPCIANAEPRIQALVAKHGGDVAWIAVAGEPLDTREGLREQKLRFGSPYHVLRDPQQHLCDLLQLDAAAQVAVLDGAGTLVYRGALDTDYIDGRGEFLSEALDAVLSNRPVPTPERPRTYGCFFSDPASCRQPR